MTAGVDRLWAAAGLALIVACSTPPEGVDAGTSDDAGAQDAGPAVDAGPVTLNDVQAQVFSISCTTSSCHSVEGQAGSLILAKGQAYKNLVNVTAFMSAANLRGEVRVKPGDPANSFLWEKISTTPPPGDGNRMPNVGVVLPQSSLDLVQQWIEQGAQCVPLTCSDLPDSCGDVDNGCGSGMLHCAPC